MIPRELKDKVIELRRMGKSYNHITRETGVASGMLSYWFSKLEWSKKIADKNSENQILNSRHKILSINKQRTLDLFKKYKVAEEEAVKQFQSYKSDPLFVGALMLYLGEGDKSINTGIVRIGNTDSSVLRIFIKFLTQYCSIPTSKIKFWLLAYPDMASKKCLEYWVNELNLEQSNTYKTQVIEGKHKTKRLRYGVGNIILSSKVLKVKILKWIDLVSKELA